MHVKVKNKNDSNLTSMQTKLSQEKMWYIRWISKAWKDKPTNTKLLPLRPHKSVYTKYCMVAELEK